jgi:hypothetical protein
LKQRSHAQASDDPTSGHGNTECAQQAPARDRRTVVAPVVLDDQLELRTFVVCAATIGRSVKRAHGMTSVA